MDDQKTQVKKIFVMALLGVVSLMANFVVSPVLADVSRDRGEALVRTHCTRCHVVPGMNPFGGIGSTPSFTAMKWLVDWRRRFEIFYSLPPHPAVVRIDGVTPPRDQALPAFSHEITITLEQLDDILAYVDTIKAPAP